jgi:hypothetical protein
VAIAPGQPERAAPEAGEARACENARMAANGELFGDGTGERE